MSKKKNLARIALNLISAILRGDTFILGLVCGYQLDKEDPSNQQFNETMGKFMETKNFNLFYDLFEELRLKG